MAIQNYHVKTPNNERIVEVVDIPDVQELRSWFVRWIPGLRYRRHPQFVCWRDPDTEKVFVSPEFLRAVCGKQNIRRIQRDCFWDGVPELKARKTTATVDRDDIAANAERADWRGYAQTKGPFSE